MKENWHNKDLQDGLGKFDSPIDLEKAWADLEAKRNPKKKKHRFFFFWLFGIATLMIVGNIFLGERNTASNLSTADLDLTTKNIKQTQLEKQENQVAKLVEPENQDGLGQETLSIDQEEKGREEKMDRSDNANSVANYKRSSALAFNSAKAKNDLKSSEVILSTDETDLSTHRIPENIGTSIEERFLSKTKSLEILQKEQEQHEKIRNELVNKVDNKEQSKGENKVERIVVRKVMLPSLQLDQVDFSVKETTSNLPLTEDLLDDLKSKPLKSKSTQFLALSTNYSFLTTGTIDEEETPMDLVSFLLSYERMVSKRIYLKTGLIFQQFTNTINKIKRRNYFEIEEDQLLANNILLDGTITETRGPETVEYRETTTNKYFNRYRFVNVPVLLGYQFPLGTRSSLKFEGGLAISIFADHSGKIKNEENVQSFENLPSYKAKKSRALQGILALQYELELRNKWFLFVGAQANQQFDKAIEINNEKLGRFGAFGFELGMRFAL